MNAEHCSRGTACGGTHITTRGTSVNWEGPTGIFSVSKSGGLSAEIYAFGGVGEFDRIVADNTHLYWAPGQQPVSGATVRAEQ